MRDCDLRLVYVTDVNSVQNLSGRRSAGLMGTMSSWMSADLDSVSWSSAAPAAPRRSLRGFPPFFPDLPEDNSDNFNENSSAPVRRPVQKLLLDAKEAQTESAGYQTEPGTLLMTGRRQRIEKIRHLQE